MSASLACRTRTAIVLAALASIAGADATDGCVAPAPWVVAIAGAPPRAQPGVRQCGALSAHRVAPECRYEQVACRTIAASEVCVERLVCRAALHGDRDEPAAAGGAQRAR